MRSRRSRIILSAVSALAALGLVLVALPDGDSPKSDVATEDPTPDRTTTTHDLGDAPAPGLTPEHDVDQELITSAPSTGAPTTTDPVHTTTTAAPLMAATTTTTPPEATAQPGTLKGRVVYELSGQAWSMLPDGTDMRQELVGGGLGAGSTGLDCGFMPFNRLDLSPDGTEILGLCPVGMGTPDAGIELRAIRVDGSGSRYIFATPYPIFVEPPRFSPDGTLIAVSLARGGPVGAPTGEILLMDREGGHQRAIDLPGTDPVFDLVWAPNGHWLAFLRGGSIDIVDVRTGQSQTMVHPTPEGGVRYPLFTPDGWSITYTTLPAEGSFGIWKVHVLSGEVEELVAAGKGWYEPCWSPDGNRLLYTGDAGLWSVAPDGSDAQLLVPGFQGRFLRT